MYFLVRCMRNFVYFRQVGPSLCYGLAVTQGCPQRFICLCFSPQATVFMALLQPAPEVFELFDDLCLLSEGRIVFMGPTGQVSSPWH